jgi:hypothetical protein
MNLRKSVLRSSYLSLCIALAFVSCARDKLAGTKQKELPLVSKSLAATVTSTARSEDAELQASLTFRIQNSGNAAGFGNCP